MLFFIIVVKMERAIENYDYSFMINLYEAISNILRNENFPIEMFHALQTLEDACELQICDERSLLLNLNGGYEFYTPLDSADFLAGRVHTICNEYPDLSPKLETLKNIVHEREEVRAEHRDLPYFFQIFSSSFHHN